MTLAEIYSKIPKIHCKGKCQDSCGPIAMSEIEAEVIRKISMGGMQIDKTLGMNMVVNFDPETLKCPSLSHGKCAIYEHRPLICRLWGVTKRMRCPFGCTPKRWLSEEESRGLLLEVDKLQALTHAK